MHAVAVLADDAGQHRAGVDADAKARPVGMRLADLGRGLLQRERGPRTAQRVVGLVAALVEDGEDLVADELVHLGAVAVGEQRREPPEIGDEHRVHVGRVVRLRERREADEVGEEDGHLAAAREGLVEVDRAEALLAPLRRGGRRDREEPDRHQRVPFPPAQTPARRKRHDDDDQCLREQREAEGDGKREPAAAAQPDAEVRDRGEDVQEYAERGNGAERRAHLVRAHSVLQRRQLRERHGRPRGDHNEHRDEQQPRIPHDPERGLEAVLDRRRCREDARSDQSDRRGEDEARVLAAHEDAGRRERVQAEEPRAEQERKPDQQQAGIAAPPRGLRDRERQGCARGAREEDDPEVGWVLLPVLVDGRDAAQQDDEGERQGRGRPPDDGPPGPHRGPGGRGGG